MMNYVEIARSWRLQNPEHADSGSSIQYVDYGVRSLLLMRGYDG